MKELILTLRDSLPGAIDLAGLTPQHLRGLSVKQINARPITVGSTKAALGDVFDVAGGVADSIAIHCGRQGRYLNNIGAGLVAGERLIVDGDVGLRAGSTMQGGQLSINGNAGDYLAAGLVDGAIHVTGNAGDFAAGAAPGERYGLAGGRVQIDGDVGHRLADRMRRGVLIVGGNTGNWPAARLIAGTVVIDGDHGRGLATGMRRGSVLVNRMPSGITGATDDPAQLVDGGPISPVYATILMREIQAMQAGVSCVSLLRDTPKRRFLGDLNVDGQGELLVFQPPS